MTVVPSSSASFFDGIMSAEGVRVRTTPFQGARPGSSPRSALHSLRVRPIPNWAAKDLVDREHYLHSMPGGTTHSFSVFVSNQLMGALTLGVGPANAHRLVDGAEPGECSTLSPLWLSDELPPNSESRVLGVVLRALKRHTQLRFLLTYADPAQGHVGVIYQATGCSYTRLSAPMPRYDLGEGKVRHSRSLAAAYGTHSVKYLREHGVDIKVVKQAPKHRYLFFLHRAWRERLRVPVFPYPKLEQFDASS